MEIPVSSLRTGDAPSHPVGRFFETGSERFRPPSRG
jgi:hypothetical protein